MSSSQNNLTRRELIATSALILGGLALSPKEALASSTEDVLSQEIEGSAIAREKWARAVQKAGNEGLPVYYGLESTKEYCPSESASLLALGTPRTVSVSKQSWIDTRLTTVTISANYGVTSANKIDFNWADLTNSMLDIVDEHYDKAILDGGRTNGIYYHAVFASPWGSGTLTGDFYAEFYYTFTGTFY